MSNITIKPVSVLSEYVGSRIPLVFVNAHNEDYRFIDDEVAVLLQQKLASEIYVRDVSNEVLSYPAFVPPEGITVPAKKFDSFTIEGCYETIDWFCRDPLKDVDRNARKATQAGLIEAGPCDKSILVIYDLYRTVNDNTTVLRALKKAVPSLLLKSRTIVIVSNALEAIPSELLGVAPMIDYPAPDLEYIRAQVRAGGRFFAAAADRDDPEKWLMLPPEQEDEVVRLLNGFRSIEIITIIRRAARRNLARQKMVPGTKPGFDMELLRRAKAESSAKSPGINIIVPQVREEGDMSGEKMVGGADRIKEWFGIQRELFADDARRDGIDIPRGALIFGMGGTGKDYLVRCLADEIGWTTVEADIGATKSPLQGMSHTGFRQILKTAEDHAPCFLVLSEFEKMFAGGMAKGSAASDAGTSTEIFATFLTWMQNRTKPIFVWALTNAIDEIPQPALRSQRFDRVWFMDLPSMWECREILLVHLVRTNAYHAEIDIDQLAIMAHTSGYTGAELRQIVNEALICRFMKGKTEARRGPLTTEQLQQCFEVVNPTGGYRGKEVSSLRDYADDNRYQKANSAAMDLKQPSLLLKGLGPQEKPETTETGPERAKTRIKPTPREVATAVL